mmetsp:Transcript_14569/g.43791  ORF Transcript_14569/g.43791 Transcript_14569/m.43791 type:complete len:257 (-) Transcript_14569:70-840(-)
MEIVKSMMGEEVTALDAINVAKVCTGAVLLALAGRKGLNARTSLYLGLHGSYLVWWLIEQWMFPPFQGRFTDHVDIPAFATVIAIVGFGYAWPAWNAFHNDKPLNPWMQFLTIAIYALGSFMNILADVQMHAMKLALAPTKALVTTGIFALCRHPAYLGDWMRYGSFCLASGKLRSFMLLGLVMATNLDAVAKRDEEGGMRDRYGQAYEAWLEATPSTFVPIPSVGAQQAVALVAGIWAATYACFRTLRSTPAKKI